MTVLIDKTSLICLEINIVTGKIIQIWHCNECHNVLDMEDLFLPLSIPSVCLLDCPKFSVSTAALKYAITNCHQLKYLSYGTLRSS